MPSSSSSSQITVSSTLIAATLATVICAHIAYFTRLSSQKEKKEKSEVIVSLPDWALTYYNSFKDVTFSNDTEMMKVAIELSARNVKENTGGPFGCAIFEKTIATGICTLFSVGVNRVVPLSNSTLHGEMVAIQFAQQKLQSFTMNTTDNKTKEYLMFTSCEPCAMCLGGTLWSGVSAIVCSASKDDAEAIGFNEGPVFPESYQQLEKAGITVKRNVLRPDGAKVLQEYGKTGVIYNA